MSARDDRRRLPDDGPDSLWRTATDLEPGRYTFDDPAGLFMARCPQCSRTLIVWPVVRPATIDGYEMRPHLRRDLSGCSGSGQIINPLDVRPVD